MEIVATHTNVIVPGVLRRGNYERWNILMRYYLLSQDLWDVVQSSGLPAGGKMSRKWMKKNALALHAIMISCGEEMFDKIKDMDSAKDVWDTLAEMHKPPVVSQESAGHPLERRTGPGNLVSSQYETLTDAISNGRLRQVKKFFSENSNPRSAIIFENGYTALHFAVYNGRSEIVDYLIKFKLSKEDLETKDDSGSTALSIAARYGIGKSIAQKLVGKNYNLLTIPDNDGKIPVELACTTIREDLTRYLYRETPLESLNVNSGVRILRECITRKMFDIVFDLLHHFPELAELASRNCSSDSIPLILTLAKTPPPFFRGSNLSFWGRFIYRCIILEADVIKEDKHRSCAEKMRSGTEKMRSCAEKMRSCAEKMRDFFLTIQHCFVSVGERFQEAMQDIQETNEDTNQETNQELQESSFKEKCVIVSCVLVLWILALPVVVVVISTSVPVFSIVLIVMAVAISLAVLAVLVGLIIGVLRILVSILSQYFGTDLYKTKLMDAYARKVIQLIYRPLSNLDQNQFVQSRAEDATIQAIKNGIPEIVKEIRKANANVLWSSVDPEDSRSRTQNIFSLAIIHRQEEVAHLLYESEKEKNMLFTTDEDGNNTLYLAAKLAPRYQLGYIHTAALQLQSELRWFKAVKTIVPGAYKEAKNAGIKTPLEVFEREHKDLLKEAVEWGKKTAESSTVVGALIITIMFAAAFTVPGGTDQSTGFPILLHKTPITFMIFMVSDAISLFAASNSVIMFLGILTAHQADEDYRKYDLVINGLASLFISIATMTIAFCAALFIMLQGRLVVVIPITLVALIPIKWFVHLQFPLLVEIMALTFNSNIFGKRRRSWMSGRIAWGMRAAVKILAMSSDASELVT